MAKKVILKDQDNVEILPITRGELIVDSSGKEAFHSNEFLATNSQPGLMSPEEKVKISTIAGNTIDSTLSTTSTNPVQNKVVTGAINEAKQLANDAQETANDASENVSKVQQIINSIKESYLKSATVDGNVLTIVDQSDSEITFTNTIYNTFLKETAANTGGRNGLVPKPNYNDGSKTRFLREDGTWVIPTNSNTTYTFANGTSGNFTVTPFGGTAQTVSIGKPATAGTADVAVKLQTKRKLWGQDFDGTTDVSGDMTGVGIINTIFNLKTQAGNASLYLETVIANTDYAHIFVSNKSDKNNLSRPLVLQHGYGNVGIGTTSPEYKLDVNGVIRASSHLITNARVKILDGQALEWNDTAANGSTSNLLLPRKSYGYRLDYYDGTAWHKLAYAEDIPTITDYYWANVLISNTSNPATSPTFANVYADAARLNNYLFMNPSGEGIYLNDQGLHWHNKCTYTKSILQFTKDGLVGIGITPSYKLHVSGISKFESTSNIPILVKSTTSVESSIAYYGKDDYRWVAGQGTAGISNAFGIWSDTLNANAMTILSSGNVGIGTTSPSCKLDIVGNARITSSNRYALEINSTINNAIITFKGTDGTEKGQFGRGEGLYGFNYEAYRNNSNGITAFGIDDNSNFFLGTGGNPSVTNSKVVVLASGYVGIGTTSPENRLDVNGIQQIYQRGNDNTAFKNLLLLKQQNSVEDSDQSWTGSNPSFGIGFRRYWSSGSSPYGETTHAGIYATVSSAWKGGLVFRTKNNQTQGGTHDTTALRLRPDGHAIFGNSIETNGSVYINQPSSNRRAGIIGTYDANRAAAIWSMGSPYQIAADGTTLGNLYGAAYVYYGSGYTFGAGKSNGHSFVWCQNGTPYVALGNNVWTSGGFIKNGSSDSYVLLGGGGHKAESSLSVNYAASAGNADKLRVVSCYNGTTNNDLWSTIKSSNSSYLGTSTMYEVYNDGGPTTYGHVLDTVTVHNNHWQPQLWMAAGKSGRLYYRNKEYNDNTWGDWRTVAWTSDIPTVTNYYWANVKVSASSSTGTYPTFGSLSVINDSCNNSTDALAYFRHYSNNDWTVKIDCGSYDYGLYINAVGSYALSVGPGASRFRGSVIIGADAAPSYTADVRGTLRATGRIYANEWIEFSGSSGLYWPNANGAHLYANTTTSYAGLITQGARNGYCGLHCGPNTNYMTVMSTDVHHGLYCENTGTWEFYYNRSSGGVGIRTSSITKNFNVSGQSYLSSNVWIGTTSGGEMLNVGGWVGTVGNTGWYNTTYAGGMYMEDSTWIRAYNNKKIYVANTDSTAFYTSGGMTALGHMYSQTVGSSWLDGQRYNNAAFNITNSPGRDSYSPWIRQTLEIGKWVSIGTLQNSLYFIGSTTSRTANSYDYGFRMDFSNGYLYGNFSGYLSGTAYTASAIADSNNGTRITASYASGGFSSSPSWLAAWNGYHLTYVSPSVLNVNYASSAGSVAWANVTGKPTIPTVSSRNLTVNGTAYTFYSNTTTAAASFYAPTSAGTSGYILQSSGGTPTWTARQDYSNPGILWVGYIYRSSRSSTSYYASKSGGKATFSLTSTPNSSYEYLSGTLSGHTSIMAAFVQTQAVFSASTTTCYAYSSINFGKGQEAGFDTYRVSISGSTIYIRACRMTDANNSSWEDDGFLCTGSGHDDDARPVARLYLMIIGY